MAGEVCPACGAVATVTGSTDRTDLVPLRFRPILKRDVRYWFVHWNSQTGVQIQESLRACLVCGLVWGRLAPEELRDFMSHEKLMSPPSLKKVEPEL
jgi:hypothetical protein